MIFFVFIVLLVLLMHTDLSQPAATAEVTAAKATTGDDASVFKCKTCGNEFNNKEDLTIHIQLHNEDKPYECYKCGCRMKQLSNMKKHIISCSGKSQNQCTICSQEFQNSSLLHQHIIEYHKSKISNNSNIRTPGEFYQIYADL